MPEGGELRLTMPEGGELRLAMPELTLSDFSYPV
jgi:hypothetical protein